MDSSIQSCEPNKNFKPKFNATANTKPRRYNKMMCSSWKISVFGILALMLAFGLGATDSFAAPVTATVAAENIGTATAPLRAVDETTGTSPLDHITFTVTAIAATADNTTGEVRITIPSGWARPFGINGNRAADDTDSTIVNTADLDEAGEVFIVDSADDGAGANPGDVANDTGDASYRGSIVGNTLVAKFGKNAADGNAVVFTYRSKHPAQARTYAFPISGNIDTTQTLATEPGNGVHKRGGRYFYDIVVGSVASGKGDVTVTGALPYKHPDVEPKGYKDNYILTSEAAVTPTFTFKAVGTMFKNSLIRIESGTPADAATGGWTGLYPGPAGTAAGKVTLGGPAEFVTTGTAGTTASSADVVVVKITADRIEAGSTITFRIDGLKAPKTEATTPHATYRFTAGTNSLIAADSTVEEPTDIKTFDFVSTSKHGAGKVALSSTVVGAEGRAADPLTYAASEEALGNLVLALTELNGFIGGAGIEIQIPDGFTPAPYKTFTGTGAGTVAVDTASALTLDLATNGKVTLKTTDAAAVDFADAATVTYNGVIKAPKAEGLYEFTTKTRSGPHGALTMIDSPKVEVVGGHGKGTMVLTRAGSVFSQTSSEAEVGNLVFTYTPGGRMAKNSQVQVELPTDWPRGRTDNGDGVADRGEVTLTGKANLIVAANGGSFTATATESLTTADRLVFTYKNIKVPKRDAPDSHTFVTRAISHPGGTLASSEIAASPNVGIGRAPDGSGSIALDKTQADAGSSIGDLAITFTAAGKMSVGATVEITIPETGGWPAPSTDVSQPGGVTLGGSISGVIPVVTATTMSATITTELNAGNTIVFTYKNLTAPAAGGQYTFTAKSTSAAIGTLTSLAAGTSIQIDEVAAGSITLTSADGMLSSAAPGMGLGNLMFTFTAGAQMASGAQVQITIPTGWSPPFLDNNDGADSAGEVSVAGSANLSVSGGGAQPWMLTATTTAALATGNTLVITYKQVTAPAAEATYTFVTKSSVATGGTLLPITSQPSVIVRTPVAAIAVHAMPTSVFAGEDVAVTVDLWSAGGELAKALGSMVVTLDDGDAGGSFSDADGNAVTSVTIADNTSSAMATYMNAAAGTVTITATSGEMTATADVEVKSTIRGLSVDNELVQQGSTVMVSAIGQAGGGTVVVLDSDGEKVGTKKALDPVGEPDADGDQEYERSITLPAMLDDGMYTVSVEIQGDVNNELQIEVVNDQTPPTVSNADASEDVVVNGDSFTLSASVAMNESMVEIASVMADLGGLDSTKADGVMLDELSSSPGTYFTIITVDDANEAEDGEYTITITATDAIGNMGSDTVMITLENDPSELTSAEVTPGSGKPGETIWIKATGSAGGDASATVNNADSGMMIAQVTLDEDEDNAGMYSGGLMIVEDAHPAGMYDVTVTLGTQMMTLEDALTIEPPGYDFTWTIGAGTHLIHVPLDVTQVDGADMMISTVRDLYNALGDAVSIIIALGADGSWNSYLGDDAPGMAFGDMMLGDSTGLVAVMNSAVTLELTGNALGTGGVSTISLNAGNNLVGVPLDSAQISMISDVLGALVSAVVVSNEAGDGFQTITQAGDPGDGPLMGGEGYIVVAAAAASIPVIGSPWQNMDGASTAPPVASGANVKTPVLHVRGQLVDEAGMMTLDGLTVSVRNVTNGNVLGSSVATDEYSMTFVKLNSSAAKVGDILEIKADSGNPLLGIRPVQHVVTAEDVLNGSISLPDLVTYEIPAQSELLANYPNPFNPETWIPFRLAEDASVSLDIYGASGALVRNIDLGFTPAAVYEGRSDAIYWDGRNNFGEQVSSGLYFYHLRAGEFSATRRMVVVK